MGCRANFVVIRDGEAKAYYDNWAGLCCIYVFAEGPEAASQSLLEVEETDELLDWAFAEGGYLLDFDRKTAIGFGCPFDEGGYDEAIYDAEDETDGETGDEPSAESHPVDDVFNEGVEAFLKFISPVWSGWKLVWDDRGVDAFAEHLGSRDITTIVVQDASHPPGTAAPTVFQA